MTRSAATVIAVVGAVAVAVGAGAALAKGPTKKLNAKDNTLAARIALHQGDLKGWQAKKNPPTDDDTLTCKAYEPDQSRFVETGRSTGWDFQRTEGGNKFKFATSTVGVFRSSRDAAGAFKAVANEKLLDCLKEQFDDPSGPKVTDVKTGKLDGLPKLGKTTVGYWLTMTLEAGGQKLPSRFDMVLFTKGRVDVGVIFGGVGTVINRKLVVGTAYKLAKRTP